MTTSYCSSCGSRFTRMSEETWKHLCYTCWKRSKQSSSATPTYGETATQLRHELHKALEEAARLRARLREAERATAIPSDIHRKLLSLAHPDKHANSQIATEATQWLLSVRGGR